MIPEEEHPEINFVGLLIGPRGNTLKSIESETGAKIEILGKGRKDKKRKKDEPLHANVTSTNPEAVKKAVDKIRNIIKEELDRHQLRELPNLNEVNDKVMIPQEEHPEIDFLRLLIGPCGNVQLLNSFNHSSQDFSRNFCDNIANSSTLCSTRLELSLYLSLVNSSGKFNLSHKVLKSRLVPAPTVM